MATNASESGTLLRPPLKRKATGWRGYSKPPPLTFEMLPIPLNIHKIIHKVSPFILNKHRKRNTGPRKLHVPGARTLY